MDDDGASEDDLKTLLDELDGLAEAGDEPAADAWEKLLTAASFTGLTTEESA